MGLKSKPSKNSVKKLVIPDGNAAKEVNSNEAGSVLIAKLAGNKTISYESKDIMLSDIRLNPDNEIFRQMDDDEDIRILAEDIKRNGLMHNLVVFPQQEDKKTVYVLLSGERRYRALNYLQEQGDATLNTVKHCNVITTELSNNEKKVLLYSANLQVRGGFGDEAVRRAAITEFIACLQKEPYNMTEAQAKKATKEISPQNAKTTEKDLRVETKLNKDLKQLLNEKFLTRSESEAYLRFSDDLQQEIARRFESLRDVDCHADPNADAGKNYIEVLRDDIHNNFREELLLAQRQGTYKEVTAMASLACEHFDAAFEDLKAKAEEYGNAKQAADTEAVAEIEHEGRKEAAKDRAKAGEKKSTAVQKCAPKAVAALRRTLGNKAYAKALKKQDNEIREADIASLNELIEAATQLRDMIEAAGNQ